MYLFSGSLEMPEKPSVLLNFLPGYKQFALILPKKHLSVEDTVNAKLLADSRSHAKQFRLLNEAIPWRNLKDIDFKKNYFCRKSRILAPNLPPTLSL